MSGTATTVSEQALKVAELGSEGAFIYLTVCLIAVILIGFVVAVIWWHRDRKEFKEARDGVLAAAEERCAKCERELEQVRLENTSLKARVAQLETLVGLPPQ